MNPLEWVGDSLDEHKQTLTLPDPDKDIPQSHSPTREPNALFGERRFAPDGPPLWFARCHNLVRPKRIICQCDGNLDKSAKDCYPIV